MSEHNLTIHQPTLNHSNSLTTNEEQAILTSFMDEKDSEEMNKHTIAMKLPRNFQSTTNEIIHSNETNENLYEYKKELPNDILDKYAGVNNKKQSIHQNKKNKKNKKV